MASLLDKSIKWAQVEYILDKFTIKIGDNDPITLQKNQIQSMYLEKDFDNDILPIFMVQVGMADTIYYDLCANAADTTITILLSGRKRLENGKYTNKHEYIKDVFRPLAIDGTPFTNKKEYIKGRKASSSGDGDVLMSDLQTSHTLILGKKSLLKNIKKVVNDVLTETSITDAISYLLSNTGFSNVLMSPLDNTKTYNELILLPMNVSKQLGYISNFFGMYKEGSQIFFDYDTSYILRNCAKCTAHRKNEIKTVNVLMFKRSSSGNNTASSGSYIDNKNDIGYINCDSDSFVIEDQSDTSDSYIGNNSLILNSSGTINEAITNDDGSYNVITTTTHNSYYKHELRLRLKELGGVVTIRCEDIDLRLMTPNKYFRLLSNDSDVSKKINHPFRLSACQIFLSMNGQAMKPTVNMVLKKTEA